MTEQYNKNLYNPSYLQTLLRDTDDKKYILVRELYEMNNVSYEKGSSDRDYAIRDMLQDVRHTIEKYHDMIKYFDNAREGDNRVLEEIIMFFEKDYIDSATLNGRIASLKSELGQDEKDTGNNIDLVQLKQRLKVMEDRIDARIDPLLREFLQGINLMLLFNRIRHMIEITLKSTDQSGVATRTENLKQYITTFLWLYKKILPDSFAGVNKDSFILETIRSMGFNESLVSRAIIGKDQLESITGEITGSIKSTPYTGEDLDEDLDTDQSTEEGKTHLDYINDLMELLYRVTYNKNDTTDPGLRFQGNAAKDRDKRFLFHEPGSFKISLKVVSDYCIDSLVFMVSWLQREFKKDVVPASRMDTWDPVIHALVQAEHFIHAYDKSLTLASHPGNQSQSVLTGEIRQYIPREHARQLLTMIQVGCDTMHTALTDTSILISEKPFTGSEQLLKRIQIARESFDNARDKIRKGTRSIKL